MESHKLWCYSGEDCAAKKKSDDQATIEKSRVTDFSIYPNPADQSLTIYSSNLSAVEEYALYNTQGKVVKTGIVKNSITSIPTQDLPAGYYVIKIKQSNDQPYVRSVVISH